MEHDIIHLLRHLKMLISDFNIYNIEYGKLCLIGSGSFISKYKNDARNTDRFCDDRISNYKIFLVRFTLN